MKADVFSFQQMPRGGQLVKGSGLRFRLQKSLPILQTEQSDRPPLGAARWTAPIASGWARESSTADTSLGEAYLMTPSKR